ncbi:hypothetical protein AB1N83_005657 [Pleurotus pulmonarius]
MAETRAYPSHWHHYDLNYQLPPLVASIQQFWTTTFQAGAVVSALLAANAINLLVLFKDNDKFSSLPAGVCPPPLLFLAYLSILINTSATVTAMIVIDMINDLAFKSSCQICRTHGGAPIAGTTSEDMAALLQTFGAPRGIYSWRLFVVYWLGLFIGGFIATIVEILLFVAYVEVKWVEIILFVMVIVVCLPPLLVFLPRRIPFLFATSSSRSLHHF